MQVPRASGGSIVDPKKIEQLIRRFSLVEPLLPLVFHFLEVPSQQVLELVPFFIYGFSVFWNLHRDLDGNTGLCTTAWWNSETYFRPYGQHGFHAAVFLVPSWC